MPTYKLTYFDIMGIAEHIRYIFAYADQPYENIRVKFADWPTLKPTTPFGKLPILEVDGKIVTQSNAIARYLAKQFGLAGKDDWEALQADALVDNLVDLRTSASKVYFEKDEQKKAELAKELQEKTYPFYLGKFNEIAANNPSGFLVGSEVTWADFAFATCLTHFVERQPDLLKNYPALTQLINKVNNLPRIKAWIETRPPYSPMPK